MGSASVNPLFLEGSARIPGGTPRPRSGAGNPRRLARGEWTTTCSRTGSEFPISEPGMSAPMKLEIYVAHRDVKRVRLVDCELTNEGYQVRTLSSGASALGGSATVPRFTISHWRALPTP